MRDKPPLFIGLFLPETRAIVERDWPAMSNAPGSAWICNRHPKDIPVLISQLFDTVHAGIHEG